MKPFLSIILPARNEEIRLPQSLAELDAFLKQQSYDSEVLIIVNASTDRTQELAEDFAKNHENFRALYHNEGGKGRAVRRGMLDAQGQFRMFCDVDFSMPVAEIAKFTPPTLTNFDIAIASREGPKAVRYDEPGYRHLTGRVFNTLIRLMVLPELQDTQCGFKCFRGDIAEELFTKQTLTGWAFDVELLAIANQRGYKIHEIPVHWYFNPESKVNVLRDSWRMFLDLLVIRRNRKRGLYDAAS